MFKKILHVVIGYVFVLSTNHLFAEGELIKAKILYCRDGDTCQVKINDAFWVSVRLAGVDAPEVGKKGKGQPLSEEARDQLNKAVQDQEVELRQTDLDQYNRPVVEIIQNKKNINLMLVEQGFAEAYKGKTKRLDKSSYLSAEAAAKGAKKGIWAVDGYVTPSEYRKEKKLVKDVR